MKNKNEKKEEKSDESSYCINKRVSGKIEIIVIIIEYT